MGEINDKQSIGINSTDSNENGIAGIQIVEPSTIDTSGTNTDSGIGSTPTAKRSRGRPAKSNSGNSTGGNSGSKNKISGTVGIENILLSIHLMMAGATKIEEFKLSEDESKKLAKAITDVNQFYNVGVDPKLMAWVNLASACMAIYAPKFVIYKMRKNLELKNKQKEKQNVTASFPVGMSTNAN